MSTELELTLEELNDLALGVPVMGSVQITLLHSLMDVLLKKLNCKAEVVSIDGTEGYRVRKEVEELKKSRRVLPPVLPFNTENVVQLQPLQNRLDKLQDQLIVLERRLDIHFEQIRRLTKDKDRLFSSGWGDMYASFTEDICTTCDAENQIACDLLSNSDFLKKLLRRIGEPVVSRVSELERKIDALDMDLKKMMSSAQRDYAKIDQIGDYGRQLDAMSGRLDEQHELFVSTMGEVQELLDAKLDKVHVPALKKYIKDRIEGIEEHLSIVIAKQKCPKASAIITHGDGKCFGCGADGAHDRAYVLKVEQAVRQQKEFKKEEEEKKCHCGAAPYRTELSVLMQQKVPKAHNAERMQNEQIKFIEGDNKKLYRKG